MPRVVSSVMVKIGFRLLSTKDSLIEGRSFCRVGRVWAMDMYLGTVLGVEGIVNAQVSMTWLPEVFMILIDWPGWSRWKAKLRAGMVGIFV